MNDITNESFSLALSIKNSHARVIAQLRTMHETDACSQFTRQVRAKSSTREIKKQPRKNVYSECRNWERTRAYNKKREKKKQKKKGRISALDKAEEH